MRVLVWGGRRYKDFMALYTQLDYLHAMYGITDLAQGGAPGADNIAQGWAVFNLGPEHSITYNADWEGPCREECPKGHRRKRWDGTEYCPLAGLYRNQEMLDAFKPDRGVACPGGSGTADMTRRARAARLPILEIK